MNSSFSDIRRNSIIDFGLLLICLIQPHLLIGQEKVKIKPDELTDFELTREFSFPWNIGDDSRYIMGIRQIWQAPGKEITIDYCEFKTEPGAVLGMLYAGGRSNPSKFIWGSINGWPISGDGTWIPVEDISPNECLYFFRGSVGVKIYLDVIDKNDNLTVLVPIINKILEKIEGCLPQEIQSYEQTIRRNQIPEKSYQNITDSIIVSEMMIKYSLKSVWDSKWPIDSTRCVMGRRHEWADETGKSIGIDICRFLNSSDAKIAVEIMGMSTMATDRVLNLENSLDSMSIIIDDWEKWGKKTNLSVIGYKKHIAFHLFQYDSSGIDTNTVRSLVELTARQIGNF